MHALGQTEEDLHDSQVALLCIVSEGSDPEVLLTLRLCDEAFERGCGVSLTRALTSQVPGGFKPLLMPVGGTVGANIDGSKIVESIGSLLTKGGLKRGERVLLNFVYPSSWIVSVPTATGNGESGTVSANNYVKGDSAVVCALPLEDDEDIASKDKVYFQDLMTQSVPQNLWQNFKLIKKTPAGQPPPRCLPCSSLAHAEAEASFAT